VDYYPFILHAPFEELDSMGLHSPLVSPSLAKNSRIVNGLVRSFLADVMDRVAKDPDDIWRRLASRLDDRDVQSLQKHLRVIDKDLDALERFEDVILFGDAVASQESVDGLLSAGKDFAALIPLIGKPLGGLLSLCRVFVTRCGRRRLSRRFGRFIRRYKQLEPSGMDLKGRFTELFGDRFAS
jgi:hypothetical protein